VIESPTRSTLVESTNERVHVVSSRVESACVPLPDASSSRASQVLATTPNAPNARHSANVERLFEPSSSRAA
jgi:hypothetical protein